MAEVLSVYGNNPLLTSCPLPPSGPTSGSRGAGLAAPGAPGHLPPLAHRRAGAAGAGGGGGEGAGEPPGVKNFEGVRPWFELPGKAEVAKERIPLRAVAPDKALHLNHT